MNGHRGSAGSRRNLISRNTTPRCRPGRSHSGSDPAESACTRTSAGLALPRTRSREYRTSPSGQYCASCPPVLTGRPRRVVRVAARAAGELGERLGQRPVQPAARDARRRIDGHEWHVGTDTAASGERNRAEYFVVRTDRSLVVADEPAEHGDRSTEPGDGGLRHTGCGAVGRGHPEHGFTAAYPRRGRCAGRHRRGLRKGGLGDAGDLGELHGASRRGASAPAAYCSSVVSRLQLLRPSGRCATRLPTGGPGG